VESLNRTLKVNLFSETGSDKTVGSFGPALKKVVKQYNTSVHSTTGFIPALLCRPNLDQAVITEVLKRLNVQASGTQPNLRYQPPLLPGDKVRIEVGELLSAIRLKQKSGAYKASHEATYSREVFTVVRQDTDNFVIVEEKPKLKFSRGACLKVPQGAKDLTKPGVAQGLDNQPEDEAGEKKRKRVSQTANLPVTRTLRSAV
jgi:hypothetical protein